jgi:shikimate kinase
MKKSISLVGMAGAGKSSIGKQLADHLGFSFTDSDLLIEAEHKESLQRVLDKFGKENFLKIEEKVLMSIEFNNTVLATGGSAIFSQLAMDYLRSRSSIIFIKVPYNKIVERVSNFSERGFLKTSDQTIQEAFVERQSLYKHFADYEVANDASQEKCLNKILDLIHQKL